MTISETMPARMETDGPTEAAAEATTALLNVSCLMPMRLPSMIDRRSSTITCQTSTHIGIATANHIQPLLAIFR